MDKALKRDVESLVDEEIFFLKENKPRFSRMVLCNSIRRFDNTEILNQFQNRVLTKSTGLLGLPLVEVIPDYTRKWVRQKCGQTGDRVIDVGFLLERRYFAEFLKTEALDIYNSPGGPPKFEKWAVDYTGEHKEALLKVLEYIQTQNSRAGSRILQLGELEIERILEYSIPEQSS